MDDIPSTSQKPGFFLRLLRFLARLLLVVLLAAFLGAALYFSVPALYRQFIQPVQEHTQQIRALQASQERVEGRLNDCIATLEARLEAVEGESQANQATIAGLSTLQVQQATSDAQLSALQTSVADQQFRSATLEADLLAVKKASDRSLAGYKQSLDDLEQRITGLQNTQSQFISASAMHLELQKLRLMQILLRADVYLAQNNYGLAAQDIQTAIDLLGELSTGLSGNEAEAALEVTGYLESALADLPDYPVIASDLLSTAWQVLLANFRIPAVTPGSASTASLAPTGEAAVTGTPALTATPVLTTTVTTTTTATASP